MESDRHVPEPEKWQEVRTKDDGERESQDFTTPLWGRVKTRAIQKGTEAQEVKERT